MEAVECVALDVRVHPVQVEAIIAATEKLVIVELQNWPWAFAAAYIQNIVIASRAAETIACEHQFSAGANTDAAYVFAMAEVREHAVPYLERGILKPDQIRPSVVPLHMV